ncbi:MAG: hypothetical protein AAF500_12915 [Myxococcota bacterium]
MIDSEAARRLLALGAVTAAVVVQSAVLNEAGADFDLGGETSVLSPLEDYGVRLLEGTLTEPSSSIHRHALRPDPTAAGLPGSVAFSSAGGSVPPATLSASRALTVLHISAGESAGADLRLRWPVTRDSAGSPIMLSSEHTATVFQAAF